MIGNQKIIDKETEFHDKVAEGISISEDLIKRYLDFDSPAPYLTPGFPRLKVHLFEILGDVTQKRVLVYGCGSDSAALWFARSGAVVDAIDISLKSVQNQKLIALMSGFSINALNRDAHKTDLPSEYYDIIYGNAILHHLDIELASQEIHRLLKPRGIAIFRDVMKSNVFLRIFRVLTPFWRTPDEHPLTNNDLKPFTEKFSKVDIEQYILCALPFIFAKRIANDVILKRLGFKTRIPSTDAFYSRLDKMDGFLFRLLPFLKSQAWMCLISLSK